MGYGYIGRCARIDLSKDRIDVVDLPREYLENYIGGYGFAAKTL
nr:hypothetical protein [Candidatus Sigynarchaeota archaeon]